MAQVLLGIGTNINRVANIVSAIEHLFPIGYELICSPVYESHAVASNHEPYFNLVARFETSLTFDELKKYTKKIEDHLRRDRTTPKQVSIDLDILTYAEMMQPDVVPHPDIVRYRHVLQPLVDVAPQILHPALQISFAELLQQLDDPQILSLVDDPELQQLPR